MIYNTLTCLDATNTSCSHTLYACLYRSLPFFHSSPVYPTAANSYNPSHGQRTPSEQLYYKTTIPINEQRHCKCNTGNGGTLGQSADGKQLSAAAAPNECQHDVIANTQHGVSSTSTPNDCACAGMRNATAKENQTTATTTTTIEYELSNGIAKLCKISTSRVAAEQPTTNAVITAQNLSNSQSNIKLNVDTVTGKESIEGTSKLPLLSETDLSDLTRNVNAINAFNHTLRHSFSQQQQPGQTSYNFQQRYNYHMDFSSMNGAGGSPLKKVPRDRLGLWGTGGDSDVPGNISGLQRLQQKKYNKVRKYTKIYCTRTLLCCT